MRDTKGAVTGLVEAGHKADVEDGGVVAAEAKVNVSNGPRVVHG